MTPLSTSSGNAARHPSYAKYFWIWAYLIALLAAGTFLSTLPISKTGILLLILLVSLIKAGLVALYYMHLRFDRTPVLWVVAIFPFFLIGLAVLLVLLGIAFS